MKEVVLQGSNDKTRPDEFYGVAIHVQPGSKNITIRNANIHGYKIAILADSVDRLTIENCDLSYNYRQELKSNRDREDISDWMSYHKNENQEWKRYGAGIYLNKCSNALIVNNTVTSGQCGLMMTGCEKAIVHDNNFSFNSGIGIGLYRSSFNTFIITGSTGMCVDTVMANTNAGRTVQAFWYLNSAPKMFCLQQCHT